MDPFSITVGAVALAETANKLANCLTDRYKAFSSAPKEMLEIAGQVTMCAGLVDVFARSVDGTGQEFPKRFQQDASTLVLQCRAILKDIDEMIPQGSKKPNYGDRLKYAFGSQKKIAKHQDNLKQVQHMFMFMTTCWQYQLPSKQQPATSSALPMGSLQGMLQHMPVQINMKSPGDNAQMVTYEATLTLKPVEQPPAKTAFELVRKKMQMSSRGSETDLQKRMLEIMRRSPYFSMKLLEPLITTEYSKYTRAPGAVPHSYSLPLSSKERDEMRKKIEAESVKKGEDAKKEKEKDEVDFRLKLPSKQEASEEVDNILSQWFEEDSEPEIGAHDSFSESEEVTIENDEPPLTKGRFGANTTVWSSSAPIPKYDWRCDGCDSMFYFHDRRFKCRDCQNFDLCPNCFKIVWHQHDISSFVERSI